MARAAGVSPATQQGAMSPGTTAWHMHCLISVHGVSDIRVRLMCARLAIILVRTNKIGFEPKVGNKDCGFIKDGRHIRCAAGGNKNTKGQGGLDKRLRYRIPPLLIEELLV